MNKLLVLCCFLFLTACTNQIGGKPFFEHIDKLEDGLDQPNWEELSIQAKELKKMYEKNKWKIQLLGDEGEYESLNESLNNLLATIKEEDALTTRMELATILTLFEDIYSL
ncbi:hypothetical protein OPHB3_1642 [Oceanobacillus picturae]|uniref:DUF4363 family protein n=1 Tax=Oceanobacillus picturae TaxID=171693 RepID=A0A0U9H4T8_9BACI|nr:DUF4363 family protein [Oceanobacillus picturae]GAQ17717.1 hypothetical protein OPHB3_1642 [Oceanobacillus picturae]